MGRPQVTAGIAGVTTRAPDLLHLPEPGGVLDQSAWLMDALELLTRLTARSEEETS